MRRWLLILVLLSLSGTALSQDAPVSESGIPPPDLPAWYSLPQTFQPPPKALWREWLDVGVLAALLAAGALAALRRSRRAMWLLMLVALGYLGFFRHGCVCPVGSIQNVSEALADGNAMVPLVVLAIFLLPLLATLAFGRTFCGAGCPLGALQDAVLVRPVKVPLWLEHVLGLGPYLYLGAAVVVAANGAMYVICQYDPFVGLFRLAAPWQVLLASGALLLIALFVGRPYCRFLCPYSAILRPLSRLSWRHIRITPDECIKCRLCENACPFNAIAAPSGPPGRLDRYRGKGLLVAALLLVPVLAGVGAWLGQRAGPWTARTHATVRLADQVRLEETGQAHERTPASDVFRAGAQDADALLAEAAGMEGRFRLGTLILGGVLGLIVGGKLVLLSVRRRRTEYAIDTGRCVSCGRCVEFCPRERLRRRRKAEART